MTVLSFTGLTIEAAADVTAPTLSNPTGTQTGQTTASGTVSTDEGNGTLYYLASTNATENLATVKAGSSQAVSATGSQSVSVTGLTASTGYYLHYAHTDAASNDSSVVSSAQFTTASAVPSTVLSFTGLTIKVATDEVVSTSGFLLRSSTFTIVMDGTTDLTAASTITVSYGGIVLSNVTATNATTITADGISAGLELDAAHDLIITVDGNASGTYSQTLLPPTGYSATTLTSIHAESVYADADYTANAGGDANNISIGDQIVYKNTTNEAGTAVVLAADGTYSFPNAVADNVTASQTIDWFYLDAQDSYGAGADAVLTVLTHLDIPQSLIVIDLIQENRTGATIYWSYPGADITSAEYNIGGAWIACTSPLVISGLAEATTFAFQIRPINNSSRGDITSTTFTTQDAVDTTPDQFSFTDQADVARSTLVESNAITIQGVDPAVDIPVTVTGGEYAVNTGSGWGAYTSSPSNVRLNYQVRVRHTSEAGFLEPTRTTLIAGGVSGAFSSTTLADTEGAVITLTGGNQTLTVGDTWTEPGYSATDNADGNVTADVIVTGTVNTAVAGTYTLTYTHTDSSSNVTSVQRVVSVNAVQIYSTPKYLMIVDEVKNYKTTSSTIIIPSGTYTFINDGSYIPDAPSKDPSSTIDYGVFWTNWLAENDTINNSEWIMDDNLTIVSQTNSDTEASVMISGGIAGTQYTATNRITTTAGRVEERSMYILCENR